MASRQKQLIDFLTRRGWDYETLSVTLGVRANTVSEWHNDTKTARQRHIEALEQLRSVPPPLDHGDDAERERRSPSSTSVASFNISTPRQRAAFLRRLLRDLDMSRSELAQSLHVGRRTVDNLLDSKYTGSDIGAIADALRYLIRHPPPSLHDRFHSDERIGKVTAPVLVMHGERDKVVPIRYGERLYALISAPKKFVRFPEGHHSDLDSHGAPAAVRDFLATR